MTQASNPPAHPAADPSDPVRRDLLKTSLIGAGGALSLPSALAAAQEGAPSAESPRAEITLQVNGRAYPLSVDTRTTLLDALREQLRLTGTKKGCDQGQCGACTVLVQGRRVYSCLSLAVMHDGDAITTIEGLGTPDSLHPLQAAFLAHDGFQCGYCTPGQICSAAGMLEEAKQGWPSHVSADVAANRFGLDEAEIRERMSGNLCRCSAYSNIVAAIQDAAGTQRA